MLGLVVGMTKKVVNRGQVEVHLFRKLRLEVSEFQIQDDKSSKFQVVKEQVNPKILAPHFKRILTANKREADTKFQ